MAIIPKRVYRNKGPYTKIINPNPTIIALSNTNILYLYVNCIVRFSKNKIKLGFIVTKTIGSIIFHCKEPLVILG
jgi:hypothetical protein